MNDQFDYEKPLENYQPQTRFVTYVPYGMTPEEYLEKKDLKKTANTIGGAFLLLLAINLGAISILRGIFAFLQTFGINVTTEFIADPAFSKIVNAIFAIFMFTLPFIIVFKARGYRISGLIRFKKPKKEDVLPFTLLGISFCSFANIAGSFMSSLFTSFGIEYEVDFGDNPSGILGFMLTIISTAIVPALVEEFACRGIMMGSLRKFGDEFAVVSSSIIFGMMHGNFQQIPFAFLVGLCLGFIVCKTGSIWIAVLIHFINNLVSVIIDYAFTSNSMLEQDVIYGIYLVIALTIGIIAFFLLKDKKNVFKFKKKKVAHNSNKLYKFFFTSGTIIVFLIICFIESLAYFKF